MTRRTRRQYHASTTGLDLTAPEDVLYLDTRELSSRDAYKLV